jgi:hypothetical protein
MVLNPISHGTLSNFNIRDPGNHRSYRGCVSVRECFLYFLHISNISVVNCIADNRTDSTSWTSSTRGRKLFGAKSTGRHITDDREEYGSAEEVIGVQAAPQLEENGYESSWTAGTTATDPPVPKVSQKNKREKGPLRSFIGFFKHDDNRKQPHVA